MAMNIAMIAARVISALFLIGSGIILLKLNRENRSIKLWGSGLFLWGISTGIGIFAYHQGTISQGIFISTRFMTGIAFVAMLFMGTLMLLLPNRQSKVLTAVYMVIVLIADFTFNAPGGSQYDNIAMHSIYVTMPISIVLFSYFYTYFLRLKDRNVLFLSIAWGFYFIVTLLHIMANGLGIFFLERLFLLIGLVSAIAISVSFNRMRKIEETWRKMTTPKPYVIDQNFLGYMNSEFGFDTKPIIEEELKNKEISSVYELNPKELDIFIENLLDSRFGNISPQRKSIIKTRIIDVLGLSLPPILNEEDDEAYHVTSIDEFYENFSAIGKDPESITSSLSGLDYEVYDKGRLKRFLEDNGISSQQSEAIIKTLHDNHYDNIRSESLKNKIVQYKEKGMDDKSIREALLREINDEEVIDKAFKKYYKKSIYKDYLPNIAEHMKNFVLQERSDQEILDIFLQHGWPKQPLEDALKMAKKEIEKEQSSSLLEENILNQLVGGNAKESVIKTISKRSWPDDELKKNYTDINIGLNDLDRTLSSIDLGDYNLISIKGSLVKKNWPEDIVNMAIDNMKKDVEFHKNLMNMRKESMSFVYSGNSSVQLKEKLIREGWDVDTINKNINKINKDLIATGDRQRLRTFNNHVFSKRTHKPRHIDKFMKGFEATEEDNRHDIEDLT